LAICAFRFFVCRFNPFERITRQIKNAIRIGGARRNRLNMSFAFTGPFGEIKPLTSARKIPDRATIVDDIIDICRAVI